MLNNLYKGKNRPTDVLAFDYQNNLPSAPFSLSSGRIGRGKERDKDSGALLTGDIIISVDTAKIQAQELGHEVKTELLILVIHGLLHLIGYDDQNKKAKTEMFAMQQKILDRLGTC